MNVRIVLSVTSCNTVMQNYKYVSPFT